jgi:hypothetical protein
MGIRRTVDQVLTAEIADGAVVNSKVNAGAAIALTKMATDLSNVVQGVGAGYRIARGSEVVPGATGTVDVVTGLTAIVAAIAIPRADPVTTAMWASCTWAAGTLTLKMWEPTAADGVGEDLTPIAATTDHQVDWIAIGT